MPSITEGGNDAFVATSGCHSSGRDLLEISPGQVPLAPLKAPDVGPIKFAPLRQLLLRPTATLAEFANAVANATSCLRIGS